MRQKWKSERFKAWEGPDGHCWPWRWRKGTGTEWEWPLEAEDPAWQSSNHRDLSPTPAGSLTWPTIWMSLVVGYSQSLLMEEPLVLVLWKLEQRNLLSQPGLLIYTTGRKYVSKCVVIYYSSNRQLIPKHTMTSWQADILPHHLTLLVNSTPHNRSLFAVSQMYRALHTFVCSAFDALNLSDFNMPCTSIPKLFW